MAPYQLPTDIQAGNVGSLFSLPVIKTLDHGEAFLVPAGDYYLYLTDADMDLECITAVTPTWTKMRDGTSTDFYYFHSDGVSIRLKNTHASTDDEVASLIKIG